MTYRIQSLALVFCGALLAAASAGCATVKAPGKNDFNVQDNQLRKGDKGFHVKAFQVPGLGDCGGELTRMVSAMARVAEVGGNTVCFDLYGFNEDGSKLEILGLKTVNAIAERGKDQHMAPLVRVLGDTTDAKFRWRAVRTAAKALGRQRMAMYLIDGPKAADLAKAFKKKAPDVVVMAEENGDVQVIDYAPEALPEQPVLVMSKVPAPELGDVHFLLSGDDASYAALEDALKTDVERQPWTPDNSVLSEEERAEGFMALFDGKTMNGWWVKGDNKQGFHASEEGYLEWLSEGAGALMSHDRYDNFILRMDWKILPGGNSGVWLRAPRNARQSKIGMEVQMRGDHGTEEPDDQNTGAIYDVLAPLCMPANPEGQWNSLDVTFNGPHLKVLMNGQVVQDVNFDEHEELKYRLRKGFICLTDHGNYVAFRNIRLKKL